METVRIYRLDHLPRVLAARLRDAQMEAARVWTLYRDLHQAARHHQLPWPTRDDLQKVTKGRFALHSQTVQMICHAFLANVQTTRLVKPQNPQMRYPYKDKRFYPLWWPAQAVSIERGRLVLPMGRGRASIVLPVAVPEDAGACQLVWKDGYELHVAIPTAQAAQRPGAVHATVDLGEIHQGAVTTNTGGALVVSGRGLRSLKRRQNRALGQLARKRSRCHHGSRRWRKLQRARRKVSARIHRQVRDLRHKGTRQVVQFCQTQQVGVLSIGNPQGVRNRPAGRHHHQRMAQWEYGQDIDYLTHKCEQSRIMSFTGPERGTSSQCPACGRQQRPRGREWVCRHRECHFRGHRDVVGSINMHPIAYGEKVAFPQRITYLRPGPVRVSRWNEEPRGVGRAGT